MKNTTLYAHSLNNIDDDLLDQAANIELNISARRKRKNIVVSGIVGVAACMIATISLSIFTDSFLFNSKPIHPTMVMSAGWANFYRNIAELEKESDFIGFIEITNQLRYNEIIPDGVDATNEDAFVIPTTIFSARVIDGIRKEKDIIEIFMTGKSGHTEIADDPLLSAGEVWFIFAKLNDDGTYSILGGPQGRFIYNEDLDTISSLAYLDSPHTRAELEKEFGILMVDLSLSDVKNEIALLRDN
ncbi:MAG: hypothetical protein LBD23_15515 [Oscillospiraceae bacterium]|jgi:hypothetical protein|nr:hypothetical protein [Oscillospiraceae bacterium]